MQKLFIAVLALACLFAVTAPRGTPAAAAPSPPAFGACRWFCVGKTGAFQTEAACAKACSTECVAVC